MQSEWRLLSRKYSPIVTPAYGAMYCSGAVDAARRVALDRPELRRRDGPLAVHGQAEGVDDTADQRLADRHLGDLGRALDGVAFLDGPVLAEEHDADLVLLEVEHHADD